jgi:hypothetical protein
MIENYDKTDPTAKLSLYTRLFRSLAASVLSQRASKDRRSSPLMATLGSYALRKNLDYKKLRQIIEKIKQEKIAKKKIVKKTKEKISRRKV